MAGETILMESRYQLPDVRGKLRFGADLSRVNWFQIGGKAEILFWPEDKDDLQYFLRHIPDDLSVTPIGVGSNLLVRDGGVRGCVIRLGKGFMGAECREPSARDSALSCGNQEISPDISNVQLKLGAGLLSAQVAKIACEKSLSGAEFLIGIPGTIGGAVAMNAGAYGAEISDICVEVEAIDRQGNLHVIAASEMGFSYRLNSLDPSWIITSLTVELTRDERQEIQSRMDEIMLKREASQPIKSLTSGSTFRNPDPSISGGKKAWQLIDEAGCRGLRVGGAMVSEKHCNFMINRGDATARDMEELIETVKQRVYDNSGVELIWEIKQIGDKGD